MNPNIKTILSDCIKVMDELPSESIDLIVTDPPYLMDYKSNYRSKDESDSSIEKVMQKKISKDTLKDGVGLIRRFYDRSYRVLKDDRPLYVCFKPDGRYKGKYVDLGAIFKAEAIRAGFEIRNTIVWVKDNWSAGDLESAFGFQCEHILYLNKGKYKFNGKRHTDVWHFDRVPESERIHPNQKPKELIARAIRSGSMEGDTVLDPFAGSGVVGIVASELGRKCILVEEDTERYKEMVLFLESKTNSEDLFS